MADFGRDPRSSDSLRGQRIFCPVNNTRLHRFLVGHIMKFELNTSIVAAVKTFGTKF